MQLLPYYLLEGLILVSCSLLAANGAAHGTRIMHAEAVSIPHIKLIKDSIPIHATQCKDILVEFGRKDSVLLQHPFIIYRRSLLQDYSPLPNQRSPKGGQRRRLLQDYSPIANQRTPKGGQRRRLLRDYSPIANQRTSSSKAGHKRGLLQGQ
ncbi:hypothetical protein GOP47_0025571 [Adiantum capillus-veneris]|uniref:Uncharacterized protein n=1 Tax=Adiantum capillus-veneris TaxID=13818 RepID=A0A9D4U0Y2_ADICA|nr:hypothetical protein GOP47_0025571 [Adiantum capillus-veneris]